MTGDPIHDEPPHHRLRLLLDLEADDLRGLCEVLHKIAEGLDREARESAEVTSSQGYHLVLACDEEQTAERFRSQLDAWMQRRRAARAARAP